MSYEKKIEIILCNKLQTYYETEKAIEDVKVWLVCEWQCGMIEEMSELRRLKEQVDIIAKNIERER